MNIFYLHYDPQICAMYHLDRHCVKMILETCQLLCTAIWLTLSKDELNKNPPVCKATHKNHPSAIWTRESKENWLWLQSLGLELCKEYTFRYNKKHKYEEFLEKLIVPTELPNLAFTEPIPAMPLLYKKETSIESYRTYYSLGKAHLHFWKNRHAWKNRSIPEFIFDILSKHGKDHEKYAQFAKTTESSENWPLE